jgi:2'-5' RNA ligase
MKYFIVIAEFKLTKKPKWLDDFRKKYDKPFRFHVALKNGTEVKDNDVASLGQEVKRIVSKFKPIKIKFSRLFTSNKSTRGWCIMISAERNLQLMKLQKTISKDLSKYGGYILPEYKKFEKNFKPHITIGRHLTDKELKQAEKELGKNLKCKSIIDSVTLMVVKKFLLENLLDRKNSKIYKL